MISMIWYDINDRYSGLDQGSFSASPSLSIDCSTIYIGSNDNYFYALDATNGNQIWNFSTPYNIISSATISGDGMIIFGCLDG